MVSVFLKNYLARKCISQVQTFPLFLNLLLLWIYLSLLMQTEAQDRNGIGLGIKPANIHGLELALGGSYASNAQTSCISSRHCPIVFIFIFMPFLSSVQVWYNSDNIGERLRHLQAHNGKQDWWVQSIQRESQLLFHHYSWYIDHLQHYKAQQHNVVILSSKIKIYNFYCHGDILRQF